MQRFRVGKSRIHGKGLYAAAALPRRRKIGELAGERISVAESKRRLRGVDVIMMVELGDGTAVDASRGGNEFRFVNHSCTPNVYIRCFRGRVELYTLRSIDAGEELTCNYGETQHRGRLPCRCGGDRCRGRL